jgi:PAS domain S-box-containing protein
LRSPGGHADGQEDPERRFRLLDEQIRVLERERQKLSAVVNHTDAGFLVFDAALAVTWANNVFAARFSAGPNPAAMRGAKCHQVLCGRPSPCEACPAALPFRSGIVAHQEMRLSIHGQTRYLHATAMPIKSLPGQVEQTILMLQDLTDLEGLRRTKEALEESEARFRLIFETAGLGMATAALDGRFLQVNPALCRFLGYSREELLEKTVFDVTHPDDRDRARELMSDSLAVPRHPLEMERRYLCKAGTPVWGYLSATWMLDADGRPEFAVGIIQDIDERRRAQESLRQSEEQLRQAQKMDAVGRLAGGVAHDFDDLLTVINDRSRILLEGLGDHPLRREVEVIAGAGERAASLSRQLLAFSRRQAIEADALPEARGTETILVVEDETMVRELARELLEMSGYTVLEASHGREALSLCRTHGNPIHLLLTDVVMPHMNGQELARTLAPLRPDMKVLYMSGYTEEDGVLREILDSDTIFLQKPFTPSALAGKVRTVLNAARRN